MHKDYQKDPTQYQNHSVHEMLNTYYNPFNWRPSALIMISDSRSSLNNSIILDWAIVTQVYSSAAHISCNGGASTSACSYVGKSVPPEHVDNYGFIGKKINYCLYKATDVAKQRVTTCYLQGSLQILLCESALMIFMLQSLRKLRAQVWLSSISSSACASCGWL